MEEDSPLEKKEKMICVRVTAEEMKRVSQLVARLKRTNKYIKKTDVWRELFGLIHTGLITEAHRAEIRGEQLSDGDTERTSGDKWHIESVERVAEIANPVSEKNKKQG